MIHFAYPNADILGEGGFLRCGRFLAAEDAPGETYDLADPEITESIMKVQTAASVLAPESFDTEKRIYEISDDPNRVYQGNSKNLAYMLALVNRSRGIGLKFRGDIWCTGSIDILDGRRPFLDVVDPEGFAIKLDGFLSEENRDTLFIVPAPIVQDRHRDRCREANAEIVSLSQFREGSLDGTFRGKTVLMVHGHELNLLMDLLFVDPGKMRVVLIYKRRGQPDERLLALLEEHLTHAGHRVFIDRHMKIGDEWEDQIKCEIRNADAVVILLSTISVYSEMLAYEVDVAYQTALEKKGKPILFPVRINFEDPLPQELSNKLAHLQYALWRDPDDDTELVSQLLEKLENPPEESSEKCGPLEMDFGAVPLDSKFYVERPVDEAFQNAILRRDTVVLLKGARQVGKTSLLARGLQQAREAGVQVVLTDFQKFIDSQLQSIETFFFAVGEILADQMNIDVCPQDNWMSRRSPNTNFERYFRREILANTEAPILWAMDEADRLFHCSFGSEIFAMFRTWHNERALNPGGPCSRLTLAIAYATEAYLFIKDQNQSPFNVGTKLVLEDFSFDQVANLHKRYGSPLSDEELRIFYQLVGGQPYLVRRGLNEIVSQDMRFDEFVAKADKDDGVFDDHLRRMLMLLNREPELSDIVSGVIDGEPCPDYGTFYRLRSAGILRGDSKDDVQLRCEIYTRYLEKHLKKAEKKKKSGAGFWKKLFSFGKEKN